MFERDYILNAIKRFFEALARITDRKQAKQYEEALAAVAEAANALVGMSTTQLVALPLKTLLDLARSQGSLDVDLVAATARLLKEHGEVLDLLGAEGSKPYYVKAFCLYDEITEVATPDQLAQHRDTLEWLMERIS